MQKDRSKRGSRPWKAGKTEARPAAPSGTSRPSGQRDRPRPTVRRQFEPREAPAAADVRFGIHAVEEALRAGVVRRVLLEAGFQSRPRLAALAVLAAEAGVPVSPLDQQTLEQSARSDRHQGALAEVRPFRYHTLSEVLAASASAGEPPFLLVLDGVEDPHNLGAILRTADAAGVHGVIVPERRSAPVTPAVARASAGAVDHVRVAQVTNLTRTLQELKQTGVWIYGLDMDGGQDYDAPDYSGGVAVVAGAEGNGLGRLVREQCDVVVGIPLRGRVESLNVSVATSLALYAVRRSRDRVEPAP